VYVVKVDMNMFVVSSLVCSIASSNVYNVTLRMFGYPNSLAPMLIFNGPLNTLGPDIAFANSI
jgi:hypothetical protein